jgi:hypothetical protein
MTFLFLINTPVVEGDKDSERKRGDVLMRSIENKLYKHLLEGLIDL